MFLIHTAELLYIQQSNQSVQIGFVFLAGNGAGGVQRISGIPKKKRCSLPATVHIKLTVQAGLHIFVIIWPDTKQSKGGGEEDIWQMKNN